MTTERSTPSPRRAELLESAYRYVLEHGLTDLSLRPLAARIGSSPRVLLFLFGSKEGLVRALLARARADELALLRRADDDAEGPAGGAAPPPGGAAPPPEGLAACARRTWDWLSAPEHRPLLVLWVEGYARSLVEPTGPWGRFARDTVDDWLAVLAAAQPPETRDSPEGVAQRTAALAVLRGGLLDLLATGDRERTTAALEFALEAC